MILILKNQSNKLNLINSSLMFHIKGNNHLISQINKRFKLNNKVLFKIFLNKIAMMATYKNLNHKR